LSIIDQVVLRDVITANTGEEREGENKAGERVIDEMKEEERDSTSSLFHKLVHE